MYETFRTPSKEQFRRRAFVTHCKPSTNVGSGLLPELAEIAASPFAHDADRRCRLRGHLAQQAPATLWEYYTQLTEVEEAFKNLKGYLGIRPIFHQLPHRIEAHIFIAFVTYSLHVTLRRRLRDLAPD